MSAQSQEFYSVNDNERVVEDYDIAASHLAARQVQTRVLLICSVLGVAGLTILAASLMSAGSDLTSTGLPALINGKTAG